MGPRAPGKCLVWFGSSQQHEEHQQQAREEHGQQAAVLTDRSAEAEKPKNHGHSTDKYQQVDAREEFICELVIRLVPLDVNGEGEQDASADKEQQVEGEQKIFDDLFDHHC